MKNLFTLLALMSTIFIISASSYANADTTTHQKAITLKSKLHSLHLELQLEQANQALRSNKAAIIQQNLRAENILKECVEIKHFFDEAKLKEFENTKIQLIALDEALFMFSNDESLRIEQAKLISNTRNAQYCKQLAAALEQATR